MGRYRGGCREEGRGGKRIRGEEGEGVCGEKAGRGRRKERGWGKAR